MSLLFRLFLCTMALGVTLYQIVADQNVLIELQMQIPILSKKLHMIEKENERLLFEYKAMTHPRHLMVLSRNPELGHLRFPKKEEVIVYDIP